ncbi:MAG: hypothetical protein ACI835_005179, partial [Planctomycetota bacterium]
VSAHLMAIVNHQARRASWHRLRATRIRQRPVQSIVCGVIVQVES